MGRLDEIRARLEAATPGPWNDDGEPGTWDPEDGYARSWVETPAGAWTQIGPCTADEMLKQRADAALIANAPADLAWLLEQNKALGRALVEHKAAIANWASVVEDAGERSTAATMRDLACDKSIFAE